jgi:hypothetical protein
MCKEKNRAEFTIHTLIDFLGQSRKIKMQKQKARQSIGALCVTRGIVTEFQQKAQREYKGHVRVLCAHKACSAQKVTKARKAYMQQAAGEENAEE